MVTSDPGWGWPVDIESSPKCVLASEAFEDTVALGDHRLSLPTRTSLVGVAVRALSAVTFRQSRAIEPRQVFATNPMTAARYRDRHGVSRKKSVPGDVLVLANILRTDMATHRPLLQGSDLVRTISVLARAQQGATRNRQTRANQLRALLREVQPAVLDAVAS